MYNILICDDQPDIVNALKIYLAPEGYALHEAFNGLEAVELAKQQELAVQKACAEVFADASFEAVSYVPTADLQETLVAEGVEIGTVFKALNSQGQEAGYVIETTSANGYGGDIVLYVGITNEKKKRRT